MLLSVRMNGEEASGATIQQVLDTDAGRVVSLRHHGGGAVRPPATIVLQLNCARSIHSQLTLEGKANVQCGTGIGKSRSSATSDEVQSKSFRFFSVKIGIGGSGRSPPLPSHTTGHAGPHPAVREVEVAPHRCRCVRLSARFHACSSGSHRCAVPSGFTCALQRELRKADIWCNALSAAATFPPPPSVKCQANRTGEVVLTTTEKSLSDIRGGILQGSLCPLRAAR